jgi:hypothetical protein
LKSLKSAESRYLPPQIKAPTAMIFQPFDTIPEAIPSPTVEKVVKVSEGIVSKFLMASAVILFLLFVLNKKFMHDFDTKKEK